MPGVDAWCALADEVVALGDDALRRQTQDALVWLGLTATERQGLSDTIRGREDPAGELLAFVAAWSRAEQPDQRPTLDASTAEMDAALDVSSALLSGPADTLAVRLGRVPRDVLAHLPADAAGSLVSGLVGASFTLPERDPRTAALQTVVDVTTNAELDRLPVDAVIAVVMRSESSEADRESVALLLSRTAPSRLVSGVLDALRAGLDPSAVVALLARAAELRATRRSAMVRQGHPPRPSSVGPGAAPPSPPPSPSPSPPPPSPTPGAPRELEITRWRGIPPQPPTNVMRTAYPRIDIDAHRGVRPDVVVIDQPFDVTVGLAKYQDAGITQTGGMSFLAGAATDLELVLVYDPGSLSPQGSTRIPLTVTDADPYPSATVSFVAQYRPDLPAERRLGVHYLRDGQVVGIAWRTFVAVPYEKDVTTAPTPQVGPDVLLDLEPLLGVDLPDLILTISASDGAATGEFVWTAYAGASDVTVPDAPRVSRLDSDLQGFVTEIRQAVASSSGGYADYLSLAGKARRLGRAVPDGIQSVVRAAVEDTSRSEAPTILLLTEELTLPWELTVLDPLLTTTWGGISPFLGAHAAIARWPLTEHQPRPTPRAAVTVKRAAVLTADYAGVMGWGKLDHAVAEAAEIAALFAPPAVTVRPSLHDVLGMLRGTPPADVVHVALHGQFDAKGAQEGLVLLGTDQTGALTNRAQFLTPDQVENGRLDAGPFVFLNACQVASDERVLGDYGGFASTLLRIGATGVVAPLWNVDDDIAAQFARDFYAATWTASGTGGSAKPVSAAEAVRAIRARYTESAAEAGTPGVTATLIAFQVFGHPRLRLDRANA